MSLNLTPLASETGFLPEANILGKTRSHKPGGQEPPRSKNTRMRVSNTMKRKEHQMTKSSRNQRPRRTGEHIAEDGGAEKGNGDNREGETQEHGLNKGTGGLKGRQGKEIETGG